jgi:hypothetical protein
MCPTEVFRPSKPLQLAPHKCEEKLMCVKNLVAVPCYICVVLIVMCISVIYKFLGLGL